MTKRNRIRFPWATTGNIIAAIVILTSAYLMTTGFYRATMVLHGEQAQYVCSMYQRHGLVWPV